VTNERIYQNDTGLWYFNVRGNQAMGPYQNRTEAQSMLIEHVAVYKRRLAPPANAWPRVMQLAGLLRRSQPRHS
jgi:hypothetical protein